jgi:hypothetical protein
MSPRCRVTTACRVREQKRGPTTTGKTVKKGAKATVRGTKKAGAHAKDAVTLDTTSARCKDGTTQTGRTKTTACHEHGGVAGR